MNVHSVPALASFRFCCRAALAAGVLAASAMAAPLVSSRVSTVDGKEVVIITNPFMELTFEPSRGGRCSSFRFLDNGEQLIGKEEFGMFLDHWAKFTWPSGLMHLPYQYEIMGDGTTTVGVRLWTVVPAMGGGRGTPERQGSMLIPTSPDLIGLIVQKTITLYADRDGINVDEAVINPLKESRAVALYIQHNFNLNGDQYHDVWYLPSTRGVELRVQPDKEGGSPKGVNWVLDPTAGWIAVRDTQTDRGLVFAFDYNYINSIYTCGLTAEWLMDSVPVAPGGSFHTQYVIKPVRGFEGFTYASQRLVADIRPREAGSKVRVQHDIAAVTNELSNVQVEFTVTGWKSKKEIARKTLTLDKLTFARQQQEFSFHAPKLTDGIVIATVVSGTGWEERYETYYDGEKKAKEHQENFWATKGGALAGSQGDAYFQKPPRKIKVLNKPDLNKVPRPAPDHFKCLVVFGLFTHLLNLDDALADWKATGKNPVEFSFVNCLPNAVEKFPGTYNELFSYNVIVLSDVNFKALSDIGFEMLCDYVEQGGSLLVTGGPYAFGNGEFEGTRFLEVLPVKLSGPFDLKWAGKSKSWPLMADETKHPIVAGLEFGQSPRVYWEHFVQPKKGAEVLLWAGNHPALVVGRYGKGKVAVWTPSPTGSAEQGEIAWWDWNDWPQLMKNIFNWLSENQESIK